MVNGIWIDNRKTGNEILDKNRLSTEGVFHFNIFPRQVFFQFSNPRKLPSPVPCRKHIRRSETLKLLEQFRFRKWFLIFISKSILIFDFHFQPSNDFHFQS